MSPHARGANIATSEPGASMNTLKEHFVHHRRYMLGCLAGALLSIIGGLVHEPGLTISGAVICAGFCLQMIRTMAFKPKGS
jgi:hypothetical protein